MLTRVTVGRRATRKVTRRGAAPLQKRPCTGGKTSKTNKRKEKVNLEEAARGEEKGRATRSKKS